ncbi:MAG: hypothetical protein SEPTF4163_002045 [Sporothrix epigloea]
MPSLFDVNEQSVADVSERPSPRESFTAEPVKDGGQKSTSVAPAGQAILEAIGTMQTILTPVITQAARPESNNANNSQDAKHNPYYPRVVARAYAPNPSFKFSSFTPLALDLLNSRANSPNFSPTTSTRLTTLVRACEAEDDFFITLSQITSLWSLDRNKVYALMGHLSPAIIDQGCLTFRGMLDIHGKTQSSLDVWLAKFPASIDAMLRAPVRYMQTIAVVGAFLRSLARKWEKFLKAVATRKYPALMDELICIFLCMSPIAQKILSIDSRKMITMTQGTSSMYADRALALDQAQHYPAPGVMIGLPQSSFFENIIKANAEIIELYRSALVQSETGILTCPKNLQSDAREESTFDSNQHFQHLQTQISTNNIRPHPVAPIRQAEEPAFDTSAIRRNSAPDTSIPRGTTVADVSGTPPTNGQAQVANGSPRIDTNKRAQSITTMPPISQASLPSTHQLQQMTTARHVTDQQRWEAQQQQQQQQAQLAAQLQNQMQQLQTQYAQVPISIQNATLPHTEQGAFQFQYVRPTGEPLYSQYTPGQPPLSQQPTNVTPTSLKDQSALLAFQQEQQLRELKRIHMLQRQQMLDQSSRASTHKQAEGTQHIAEQTRYGQQVQQGQHGQPSQQWQYLAQQPMQQPPQQLMQQPPQQLMQQPPQQPMQAQQAPRTVHAQRAFQEQQLQRMQHLQHNPQAFPQYSHQVQQSVLSQQENSALSAQQPQQLRVATQTRDTNQIVYAQQNPTSQNFLYNVYMQMQQQRVQDKQRGNQTDASTIPQSKTPFLENLCQPRPLITNVTTQAGSPTGSPAPGQSLEPQTVLSAPALLSLQSPNSAPHNPDSLQLNVRTREQSINVAAAAGNISNQHQKEARILTQQASHSVQGPSRFQPELQSVQGQVLQRPANTAVSAQMRPTSQVQSPRPLQEARQAHLYIVPPAGTTIPRIEFPYFSTELRAVQMSLMQLDRRDPSQIIIDKESKKLVPPKTDHPMFYQYIQQMAAGPDPTPMSKTIHTLQFSVTKEEHALRSQKSTPKGQLLPIETLFDGSLDYRVRCCVAQRSEKTMTESDWVISDTKWPVNIFIQVNGTPVFARRQSHNGKDLSITITELVQEGVNRVEVVIPEESHKSGPRPNFFFGVEIIETAHRHRIIWNIEKFGKRDASVTVDEINARLQRAAPGDDDFVVLQDSISVDLADPFSAKTFQIPVRGEQCRHIECFDLINWLNTRPCGEPLSICQHVFDCQCPKLHEPTLAYKWRCPICFKDARPSSLRVDQFLMNVRSELEKSDKLGKVKSILVGLDGNWNPVATTDNDIKDSDIGEEVAAGKRKMDDKIDTQPPHKYTRTTLGSAVATSAPRTTSAVQTARDIDVIEIQD